MKYLVAIFAFAIACSASANIISLNFSENAGNQPFAGGELIGPLGTDSTNWNTTDFPDVGNLTAGSLFNLVDDTGTPTGASVDWTSSNTWYNHDGIGSDEAKLSVGYLDDGGNGYLISLANIPYASYKVYGLIGGDQNQQTHGDGIANGYDSMNVLVNGAWVFGGDASTVAASYGTMENNNDANGENWTQLIPGQRAGNYWTMDATGAALTVQGQFRNADGNSGTRGTLTAVIIEDTSMVIPEPATAALALIAIGLLAGVRRRG